MSDRDRARIERAMTDNMGVTGADRAAAARAARRRQSEERMAQILTDRGWTCIPSWGCVSKQTTVERMTGERAGEHDIVQDPLGMLVEVTTVRRLVRESDGVVWSVNIETVG
jgi:hypothetical protein